MKTTNHRTAVEIKSIKRDILLWPSGGGRRRGVSHHVNYRYFVKELCDYSRDGKKSFAVGWKLCGWRKVLQCLLAVDATEDNNKRDSREEYQVGVGCSRTQQKIKSFAPIFCCLLSTESGCCLRGLVLFF